MNDLPAVGFYFQVTVKDLGMAYFKEVSGLFQTLETETIQEESVNRFTHKVPGRTFYSELVLKRGLMVSSSPLANWCMDALGGDLHKSIEPKQLTLTLLDEEHNPVMAWNFVNAYPIKWEISSPDAMKNEILIESITFAYNYFITEPQ